MKSAVLLIGFLTGILPAPPSPPAQPDPPSSINPGNDEDWNQQQDNEVTSCKDYGPWCPPERNLLDPIYWEC